MTGSGPTTCTGGSQTVALWGAVELRKECGRSGASREKRWRGQLGLAWPVVAQPRERRHGGSGVAGGSRLG
jgi:hypothetical protein